MTQIERRKSNPDLALLLENILSLVDETKKDISQLDTIIKTNSGYGPGVLIDLEKVKARIVKLEDKLADLEKYAVRISKKQKLNSTTADHEDQEKRIKRLERQLHLMTGGLMLLAAIAPFALKLINVT